MSTGLVKLPALKDYWSTHPILSASGIVKGMPRNRFMEILSNLPLNDNSTAPQKGTPGYN